MFEILFMLGGAVPTCKWIYNIIYNHIHRAYIPTYKGYCHSDTHYMGVSENSVPLNPMVLLIIIPIKWLFVWEYTLFSDKPI